MDEQTLQQQYEQTGNLLDVLKDPIIRQQVMQLEADCGDIGAGFPAYSTHPKPVTPDQAASVLRTVRLQSIAPRYAQERSDKSIALTMPMQREQSSIFAVILRDG